MKEEKEFFQLIAWIEKKRKVIGYAYKTRRGSIRLKADEHLDAHKIGRALMDGLEITKKPGTSDG